jgi:hypothetical protein
MKLNPDNRATNCQIPSEKSRTKNTIILSYLLRIEEIISSPSRVTSGGWFFPKKGVKKIHHFT